jgi:hypothetical protein
MKYIVFHKYYGCDTGCCGHTVVAVPDDVDPVDKEFGGIDDDIFYSIDASRNFMFDHPAQETFKEFTEEEVRRIYGEEHVKDLDWEHCIIQDD